MCLSATKMPISGKLPFFPTVYYSSSSIKYRMNILLILLSQHDGDYVTLLASGRGPHKDRYPMLERFENMGSVIQ